MPRLDDGGHAGLAAQEKCVKAAQRLEKQQKDLLAGLEKDKGEIRKELEKKRKENQRRTAAHAQNAAGARAAELAQKVSTVMKLRQSGGAGGAAARS